MSSFNYNNDTVKVKRMPFVDKTNLIPRENLTSVVFNRASSKEGTFKPFASMNPKVKLKSKVHLQSCVILDKEFSSTSDHLQSLKVAIEQTKSNDPKFELIPKVHLQRDSITSKELSSTSEQVQSQKVTIEQIILNDLKFKLIPTVHLHLQSLKIPIDKIVSNDPKFKSVVKVHVQRLNIKDKMPNLPSTKSVSHNAVKKNGIVGKISTNSYKKTEAISCIGGGNLKLVLNRDNIIIKAFKHVGEEVLEKEKELEKNYPDSNAAKNKNTILDPKFYQKVIVQVNRCKELEEILKLNNKFKQVVKKVHFTHDINSTPKFDKALRKRRTKNYAELSFKDSLSPVQNLEQSYKEHVPVYLQSTTIKQKQREKDPFEFISDSLSDDLKKKHRGRPRKGIRSPLQTKKKRRRRPTIEQSSDSESYVYDQSMHEILKAIRLRVSPKKSKSKYVKRVNVKQNNNVKVITNQILNRQVQIAPSRNNLKNKNVITESSRNKNGSVVLNVKVRAEPNNMHKELVPVNTESREQNFNKVLNKNANALVLNSNKATSSKDVANKGTLRILTQQIQNISRRISRTASENIEVQSVADDCGRYFGFDEDYEDQVNDISRVLPGKQGPNGIKTTLNSIKPITISQRFTSLTSTPLPLSQKHSLKTKETKTQVNPKRINIISNILVSPSRQTKLPKQPDVLKTATAIEETSTIDTSCAASLVENDDDDDFLGFDNSHLGPSSKTTLQNSKIPKHDFIDSVTHKTKSRENDFRGFVIASKRSANVNTLKRQISNRISSPWRGDCLHIKRNPHFLTMKDTSLPCYNQEMILDAKLFERPKTPRQNEEIKSDKVQKSILDYVSSNKVNNESTPTKKNHNKTLFDDDDFSPIRNNNSPVNSSPNDNSKDENNEKLQTPKGKRNIFRVCRKKNKISPLRQRNREEPGVENYFGFDSPDDRCTIGKENGRMARNRTKCGNNINEEALPMRVPMKQLKKVREEIIEELLDRINLDKDITELPAVQEVVKDVVPSEKTKDDNVPHVGLFDDLSELKPSPRIYVRKRTKITRAVSVDTDVVEEEKPKRKRKDMPTPAEEEEFNKWAAAFNAMCNEVEKHNLETD